MTIHYARLHYTFVCKNYILTNMQNPWGHTFRGAYYVDRIYFFLHFSIRGLLYGSLRSERFRTLSEQGPREYGASKRGGGWEERRKRLQTNPGILKTTRTACHA